MSFTSTENHQPPRRIPRQAPRARRGSAYLAVLGTSLVATTLLSGAMFVQQAKIRADRDAADGAIARQAAESGIELARAYIEKVPSWRTSTAINVSGIAIGNATIDVTVTDPTDNDVTDRPYDPVMITCTARAGRAEQLVTARLNAVPVPIDSLAYAAHAGDRLYVYNRLSLGAGTVSVNNFVENYTTIEGNAITKQFRTYGTITGAGVVNAGTRTTPASSIAEWYASFGTQLVGVTTIDKRVLSPQLNPFGLADPEGVYVIRANNDVIIKNSRILGTLIVICPGYKVTVDNNVLIESASRDFPALIVVGNVESKYTTQGQFLTESAHGVNFNPVGAPYNGVTDGDTADSYPSEIRGLVHATGYYQTSSNNTVRGVVFADTFYINSIQTIAYNSSLYAWPPMGYAKQVDMPLTSGSLQRTVR